MPDEPENKSTGQITFHSGQWPQEGQCLGSLDITAPPDLPPLGPARDLDQLLEAAEMACSQCRAYISAIRPLAFLKPEARPMIDAMNVILGILEPAIKKAT